jgi:hypothetical protein
MKTSSVILACITTALATGYLGLRAGTQVGRNQAAHEAANSRRMLGVAISDMVDTANRGNLEALKRQVTLFYDQWYHIEFVPDEDTPPAHLAENVAVSIVRSEKPK